MSMTRRQAIAKATIDTPSAAGGLLTPQQSRAFIWRMKDNIAFSNLQRLETRVTTTGSINKAFTNARIIRLATENSDDGYRAGAGFPTVSYTAKKVRLPWEVDEDVFHENIEGEALEQDLVDQMTMQFAIDLEDLEWNGDETSADPFLGINTGVLKLLQNAGDQGVGGTTHRVDGSTINAGAITQAHFFTALKALPNKYRRSGQLGSSSTSQAPGGTQPTFGNGLVWAMSPNRRLTWLQYLSNRATPGGDQVLLGNETGRAPLGIPIVEVPSMPDSRIVLTNPKNVTRVITWDIRKRKVTGDTDAELAALDKRFYVFFIKHDVVLEEFDAIVDVFNLV